MNGLKRTSLKGYTTGEFSPGRNKLIQFLWYFTNVLFFMNPLNPVSSIKVLLLRLFGAKIGRKVNIKPGVNIKYPWRLEIGDYSWIGEKVWIDNLAKVKIGSNACISQGALLLTGNHNYKKTGFDLMTKEIILEDGVWIGAKALVAPGSVCLSHSVLTANSILTGKMEPYSIYSGNPAIKIRERVIN